MDRTIPDRRLTLFLMATAAYSQISTGIYLPSLPVIAREFATTQGAVQLSIAIFYLGYAVSVLVVGPLSDRFGRRMILLIGTVIYVLASLACALAGSIESLVVARFVQAFGACSGFVSCRAIVRDCYAPGEMARTLGMIMVVTSLSVGIGPMIGGQLHTWLGWRSGFAFLVLYGLALLPLIWWWLPETAPRGAAEAVRRASPVRDYGVLVRSRVFLGYTFAMSFGLATLFVFHAGVPVILISLSGVTPAMFGVYFFIVQGGVMAGNFLTNRLARRVATMRLLAVGLMLIVAGAACLVAIGAGDRLSVTSFVAAAVILALGWGIVSPTGPAGAIGPFPGIAATAAALNGFIMIGIAGLATLVLGALPKVGLLPMALLLLALGAAGAASLLLLRERKPSS